jgi:hypothetical protein
MNEVEREREREREEGREKREMFFDNQIDD